MTRFRFILICLTLAAGTFAMADAARAGREPAVQRHDQPARPAQLIQQILTAPTPEAAREAGAQLRVECEASRCDPSAYFR